MATIILSSLLTTFTQDQGKLDVPGKTLFSVLLNMIQSYPQLRPHLFDVRGDLTKAMNFYINDETIPKQHWQNVPLSSKDTVSIFLAGRHKLGNIPPELPLQPLRNEKRDRLKLVSNR